MHNYGLFPAGVSLRTIGERITIDGKSNSIWRSQGGEHLQNTLRQELRGIQLMLSRSWSISPSRSMSSTNKVISQDGMG